MVISFILGYARGFSNKIKIGAISTDFFTQTLNKKYYLNSSQFFQEYLPQPQD